MDFRQLRYFVAIVERGSFAGASEACHVSQPAISAMISQLEATMAAPLLERGSFGARPTAFGREFYNRAKLILSEVKRAGEELAVLREGKGGTAAIGVGQLAEHALMPDLLSSFRRRWPEVSLTIRVGSSQELFEQLKRGELDLTINSPPGPNLPPAGVTMEVLRTTQDVIVGRADHPLWAEQDLSLSALARFQWIASARSDPSAQNFFLSFLNAGVAPPAMVTRVDSLQIISKFLVDQPILAVVSPIFVQMMMGTALKEGHIRMITHPDFAFPRQVCLATRTGTLASKPVIEFCAMVRAACADAAASEDYRR